MHTLVLRLSLADDRYDNFVYDAYTDPEILRTISNIARIDPVPVMDYEIGCINIFHRRGSQRGHRR